MDGLEEKERIFALQVCILVWIASKETIIPKSGQLEQVLCYLHDRNSILIAGTCFGKTLTIVISLLLEDPADDAIAKFGIPTTAINEDSRLKDKEFKVGPEV